MLSKWATKWNEVKLTKKGKKKTKEIQFLIHYDKKCHYKKQHAIDKSIGEKTENIEKYSLLCTDE